MFIKNFNNILRFCNIERFLHIEKTTPNRISSNITRVSDTMKIYAIDSFIFKRKSVSAKGFAIQPFWNLPIALGCHRRWAGTGAGWVSSIK